MITLFAAAALATPCEDTLDLLERGVPTASVADVVRTDTWDAEGVDCLDQAGAPGTVVVAAARTASIPAPTDDRPRRWEIAVGSGWIPNPRIETAATVDLGVTWFPAERLGIAVDGSAGVQPRRDGPDGFGKQIIEEPVGELTDRVDLLGTATLQFVPIRGELHTRHTTLGLGGYLLAGTGLVSTVDDHRLGETRGFDERFRSTEAQTHPVLVIGGGLRIAASPAVGFRIELDQARWIEVYEGTTTVQQHRESVSAALAFRPAKK